VQVDLIPRGDHGDGFIETDDWRLLTLAHALACLSTDWVARFPDSLAGGQTIIDMVERTRWTVQASWNPGWRDSKVVPMRCGYAMMPDGAIRK
jgi:hypothetical protein